MIPIGDVVPRRTRPGVTVALAVAQAGLLLAPAFRPWGVLWIVNAAAIWIFGCALEDRMGRGRFAALATLGAAVASAVAMLAAPVPLVLVASGGLVAALAAGYLAVFPRSRVLSLVPVLVGIELVEIPAWFIALVWGAASLAAALAVWSSAEAVALLTGWVASAGTGAAAAWLLKRPERMAISWWGE